MGLYVVNSIPARFSSNAIIDFMTASWSNFFDKSKWHDIKIQSVLAVLWEAQVIWPRGVAMRWSDLIHRQNLECFEEWMNCLSFK